MLSGLSGYVPGSLAGDISFWLFFGVASLVLGLYLGRSQLINAVLYAYIAVAILGALPDQTISFSPEYGRLTIFVTLLVVMIVMGDYLFDIHVSNVSSDFFWRILVMSFLTVGMLLSIVFSLLPKGIVLEYVSSGTRGYFVGPWIQVVWLALPLVFLLFVNKRR